MARAVLLRPECMAAAGDLVTATLLSQIVYWCLPGRNGQSKLRVLRHGVYWIVKTREQWMNETGLTLDQYRRAIGVLKRRQLVEVRVMRFKGIAQSHLRLQSVAFLQLGDNPSAGKGMIPQPNRSTYSTYREDKDQIVFANRGSRSANTYGDQEGGEKPAGEVGSTEAQQDVKDNPTGKGWFMKAADILKAHQAPTDGSLGAYWKSRCALLSNSYQKPLTAKEAGQLKQLHTYLGDHTKPVIAYAVEHWWKFASQAGAAAGVTFPAEPHIGFLLTYHAVAVNLLTPEVATPPPVEAPVQLVATGTEKEAVYVPSSQELTELLDGLKSP